MKTLILQIPGQESTNNAADNTETLVIEKTYVISSDTRGDASPAQPVQLDEEKVIQFEFGFDDVTDTIWLGDLTTIDELFPSTSAQVRSLGQDGKPSDTVVIDIPVTLSAGDQSQRGFLKDIVLKVVKIFTKKAVKPLVKELAGRLEDKALKHGTGLFKLTEKFEFSKPTFGPDSKYLLFLHGTASSTEGSFSELQGSATWTLIHQTFGNNVLAFEHETLTKSPLENVLELVRQLPPKAALTIISHSRGGLVGDTLNRFFAGSGSLEGFSVKEKNYLRKQGRSSEIDQIEAIAEVIRTKNLDITIEKFIRVACTASGTTLASRRLDIYFNVLFNIIGLATAQAANPVYVAFKDLISSLLENKNDTEVLPGLEAQNPLSPFNQMLNNADPDTLINTPLIVIAGDAKLSLRWRAVKVALTNLFFLGDNDFVVDTRSMYNGARRMDGKVQYFFDEGGEVSHFDYFKNFKTQNALRLALQTPAGTLIPSFTNLAIRGFTKQEIRNIEKIAPGGKVFLDTVSGKKPIVVLLPGIMGSTLTVGDDLVWINFFSFIGGGLTRLTYNTANNLNVKADGLVGSSYRKLVEFLKREYDVVTFPFDWRTDMATNAATLNQKILDLMKFKQPIKLIGHSMGGVLIRDFIISYDKTWQALNASKNFRLLFLGTPLGGSFRIPYTLFGLDSIIRTLDFVDITNSQKDLLSVFAQFPGILSLLPLTTNNGNDFAKVDTWEAMRNAFGDPEWPIPSKSLLTEFKLYQDSVLSKATNIDFTHAAYIAGQARRDKQTISGYRIDSLTNTLEFLATKEGDESVTWDSGISQAFVTQNSVYYSDVTHGELANDPKLFGAIKDLLNSGSTNLLRRTRPTVRSLEKEFKAKTLFDFNLSAEGVENTLLGLGTESRLTASVTPINVMVSNGHLQYATYPVMVGHFEGDGIVSAEKAVDRYLQGELSRRHQLGLYPGKFGTSEAIINQSDGAFKGAVVLGLGQQGQLTEFRLTSSVELGIANYLAEVNNRFTRLPKDSLLPKPIGVSSLLIGSDYGGLRIENVVRSIIQGVQNANDKIRRTYDSPQLIDTVEFVELYRDRALACVKVIGAIEQDENRSLTIFMNKRSIKKLIGWQERLPVDDTTNWWTVINVRRYIDEDGVSDAKQRGLRFAISTNAARVEERTLRTNNNTLMELMEELSTKNEWSPKLAKAIFELLIPNDFKDQVKRQSNINWIVDSYTAALPWELLQDNIANARPLSINAGMIRQLATTNSRININPVIENTAIVIGDPDLKNKYGQLKGAEREGIKMAQLLETQGFDVESVIKGSSSQILRTLFSKNYKIVHLAGHGIFNSDPKQYTGMLIGPDDFLTTDHINQMSYTPELVFVNCCYLGQTDGTAEELSRSRFRLAANIGTQLIEIGVKAVVVAGWAVDDTAALEFAEQFYQCMFESYTFGEAVRKARQDVYQNHGGQTNTWGAYQCYGDPSYKLLNNSRKSIITYQFVIAEEAEIELSNLYSWIEKGAYDKEEVLEKMAAIADALEKTSLKSGRTIELQALIYADLGLYEQAVEKFEDLWKEEKATFSFSATEQYCNTKVKLYAQEVKKGKDRKKAIDRLISTIAELENFVGFFGKTLERIHILASAYKRLAQVYTEIADKKKAYECSGNYYQQARKKNGNKAEYYALANWVSIENALVLANGRIWGKPGKKEIVRLLDVELKAVTQQKDQERDYWDLMAEPTLLLTKTLIGDAKNGKLLNEYNHVRDRFVAVWQTVGTVGQHQADIEQLEFLEDAFGMSSSERAKELRTMVSRLKAELEMLI